MKLKNRTLTFVFVVLAFVLFLFNSNNVAYANENIVYLGGFPAGFSISTKGCAVVGLCDVVTLEGSITPSKDAELLVGDIILSIDDVSVNSASDIEKNIKKDSLIKLKIKRCGEIIEKNIKPAKDLSGSYKLGVFIRDDVCGIGTVTYINNNRLASLGHPIIDENGEIIEIMGGSIFSCKITGCIKGEKGKAGELRGVFNKLNKVAKIDKNLITGVYGEYQRNDNKLDKIEIGVAKIGDASIYTTIDGDKPKEYKITIIKIDASEENKNFVIKVLDKELLDKTGGIVQGMSGSPIVQNGKLVGAVTHVFINDPTRGFGISITNMINN